MSRYPKEFQVDFSSVVTTSTTANEVFEDELSFGSSKVGCAA